MAQSTRSAPKLLDLGGKHSYSMLTLNSERTPQNPSGQQTKGPLSCLNNLGGGPFMKAKGESAAAIPLRIAKNTPLRDASVDGEAVRETGSKPLPAELASTQVYSGIDGLDHERRFAGWAWAADAKGEPLLVCVYEDSVLLAQGPADRYRADIKAAGYGDGNSGFVLPLPEVVFDGAIHRLRIHIAAPTGTVIKTNDIFLPSKRLRAAATSSHVELKSDVYAPGQVVRYSPGATMAPYNIRGWGEVDDAGVWMQGADAVLELLIRRPAEAYTLEFEMIPGALDTMTPTLEVFFNYMRVGCESVRLPRLITLSLPAELFLLRRSVIGFHCREALSFEAAAGRSRVLALRQWTIF